MTILRNTIIIIITIKNNNNNRICIAPWCRGDTEALGDTVTWTWYWIIATKCFLKIGNTLHMNNECYVRRWTLISDIVIRCYLQSYDNLMMFYDTFRKVTYDYRKKILWYLNDNLTTGLRIILRFCANRAPGSYSVTIRTTQNTHLYHCYKLTTIQI